MLKSYVEYYPTGIRFVAWKFARQLAKLVNQVQIETDKKEILFLCIGSDRSTGDSLGPLVGHLLSKREQVDLNVIGTLTMPVHAMNLSNILNQIRNEYADSIVIAIDASLGKREHISQITLSKGPIFPGLGVNKKLESVGDIAITGIVGSGRRMEPLLLQNARLSLIMELADCISEGIIEYEQMQKRKKPVEHLLVEGYQF